MKTIQRRICTRNRSPQPGSTQRLRMPSGALRDRRRHSDHNTGACEGLMKHSLKTAVLLASVAFFGAISAQDGPDSVTRGTKQFQKKVLVSGLEGPWELTWGPDNMLWVTERTGKRVTRIDPATGERSVAITIDEVSAPGGQDGLLGMALHPELLKGTGNDYVYVAYTYVDEKKGPDPDVADPASPYRYLYGKIVRLHYNAANRTLSDPVNIITGLPAGDDHVGGRLEIRSRTINSTSPSAIKVTISSGIFACRSNPSDCRHKRRSMHGNYASYVGKSCGSIWMVRYPADNPKLNGVVSHVYTYGHRNPQGLDFARMAFFTPPNTDRRPMTRSTF